MRRIGLVAVLAGLLASPVLAQDHLGDLEALAMTGDYQAQRNTAYCLATAQCRGLIAPRKLDACAWRFVILGSGHRLVDESDVGNYRSDCSRLSAEELATAQRKAATLFEGIYHRPLVGQKLTPSL